MGVQTEDETARFAGGGRALGIPQGRLGRWVGPGGLSVGGT